jgi:Flp pilus assembly CpaE family ATPase
MYPLNIILVGGTDPLLSQVRQELAKASIPVQSAVGSTSAAIEQLLDTQAQRRLFLVHVQSAADLPELKRLSGSFVGMPILALVESAADFGLLIRANRAGATQVVGLPLDGADFQAALDCLAVQFGYADSQGQIIAVAPVTGDCGGTPLAFNLAHAIASRPGFRCLFVEFSPLKELRPVAADGEPISPLAELLRAPQEWDLYRVQSAVIPGPDDLDVLPGPDKGFANGTVSADNLAAVLQYGQWLADVVVLEVRCTYDEFFYRATESASAVVLVGDQKLSDLRNLKLAVESLAGLPERAWPQVVVNRYDGRLRGLTRPDLQQFLQVPQVHTIAHDPHLALARQVWRRAAPRSPALADVEALANTLLGGRAEALEAGDGPTFLGRLGQMFRVT